MSTFSKSNKAYMLIVAAIGYAFYNYSSRHELQKVLWVILGIASYFLGQLIAGFFIGAFAPQMLESEGELTIAGLVSGIISVLITFFMMSRVAASKKAEKAKDDKVLDNDLDLS